MSGVSGGTVAQEWIQRSSISVVANIHATFYSRLAQLIQHTTTAHQCMESVHVIALAI